jgi:hypothetical protein
LHRRRSDDDLKSAGYGKPDGHNKSGRYGKLSRHVGPDGYQRGAHPFSCVS